MTAQISGIKGLIGAVEKIVLTDEIKPRVKILFAETPTSGRYQHLIIDFKEFLNNELNDNFDERIIAELGQRGIHGLPEVQFRRSGQPSYDGFLMRGTFPNAVEIQPLSIGDSKAISSYTQHLKQELDIP
ncbi:hypothetical protein HYT23_02185 [Candidatus Pacearchaeota archaeon]|nr:hypothetical protein [Candidatus Pacearchaeota archaeon]